MRKVGLSLMLIAVVGLWATPAYAQSDPYDIAPPPRDDGVPGEPQPVPIYPSPVPTTTEGEQLQLVGFTTNLFPGNAGVLQLSMACQAQFTQSRMCTVDEIRRSTYFPAPLGVNSDSAWAQNLARADALFLNEPDLNCSGWMSNDHMDYGTTVNLGDCYGGIKTERCHVLRSVACCSKVVPRTN